MNARGQSSPSDGKASAVGIVLKVLLAYVCLSHLILGALAFFFPSEQFAAQIIKAVYGADVAFTPQLVHLIRMLGAFLIAIGFLSGLAFMNPSRNRPIIWGIIVLLVLRVVQRLMFMSEIQEAFGITGGRLIGQSIFFLAIAAALYLLLPKHESTSVS